MKDYSLNFEEQNVFIKHYTIDRDYIEILLGTNEKYKVLYTEETEKKILEKMKSQLENTEEFSIRVKKKINSAYITSIPLSLGLVGISCAFLSSNELLLCIPLALLAASQIAELIIIYKNKAVLDDLKKNKLFVTHEEEINKNLKNNENVLINSSKRIQTMAHYSDVYCENDVLNINNMDIVTLKELREVLDNISREEAFGFNDDEMTLTKKKK